MGSFFGLENNVLDLLLFNRRRTHGGGGLNPGAFLYDYSDNPFDGHLLLGDTGLDRFLIQTPYLPTPVTVNMRKALLDGDSLSSSQIWATPTATNIERRAGGYWTNFAAQTYQMYDVRYAQGFGTSGHSAEDILAGIATPIAYAESAVVDDVFLCLGTNDVEGATTLPALQAIYEDIIGQYANCTAEPYVWITLAQPRGDWEGDTEPVRAGYITRLYAIRQALRDAVTAVGKPTKIFISDPWNYLVDPDVINPTTGLPYFPKADYYLSDGVHWLHKGAHYVAKTLKTLVWSTLNLTNPTSLPSTAGAYNTNPSLAGSNVLATTGGTGFVANNVSALRNAGSTVTVVGSKETKEIFGISQPCQKLVIANGTLSTEEVWFHAEFPLVNQAFDNTTGIEFTVPIRILASPVGVNGCYLYARATIGSTYTNKDMAFVTGNTVPDNDPSDIEWLLRTEPLLLPTGTTTTAQLLIRVPVNGTIVGNGMTMWVGQPTAKKLTP